MRTLLDNYPMYDGEIAELRVTGITPQLMAHIIAKHAGNSAKSRSLYERYQTIDHAVPIFMRRPRFGENGQPAEDEINNKVNNDFFGEIIDVKVGYFAGNPITYSYSTSQESEGVTGSEEAVVKAGKALTDFTARNNMFDLDMEATKLATICGYAARLFYIDRDGNERAMVVNPYEAIILSNVDITEPEFAVRYFTCTDVNDKEYYKAEFYDDKEVVYFEGGSYNELREVMRKPHVFDYCPLQGIPNNRELIGDTDKVLDLIDSYDKTMSDASNEIEGFANAYMVFENINISDDDIRKAKRSGAFQFFSSGIDGKIYFLTKEVNNAFFENHLNRIKDNIYRFGKTPNLSDETFGTPSGVALKFKITALEAKCGMFEAKMRSAGQYMFKLLASSWAKRGTSIEPLQCLMDFKRNFPLDLTSEATACATLIGAGLPKEVAFAQLTFIDDVKYVMDLIEQEQAGIAPLDDVTSQDKEPYGSDTDDTQDNTDNNNAN